jgi:hypothetical protein
MWERVVAIIDSRLGATTMDEQIEDFNERIFCILSTEKKKKKITVDFIGFNDQNEMNSFKDFIALTLSINQFNKNNIVDRDMYSKLVH